MGNTRTLFALLILLLGRQFIAAQDVQGNLFARHPHPDSLRAGWSVTGSSLLFFKNNEYASRAYPGFTALGAATEAALHYAHNSHTFTVGGLWQTTFGTPGRNTLLPIITYRYALRPEFHVILGTLDGPEAHLLPRELFGLDQYLQDPLEYGLQFTWKPRYLDFDTWIDWRRNIVWNDSAQESFTQGTRLNIKLVEQEKWKLSLPANLLFYHTGGQIDRSDAPVTSLINYSLGAQLTRVWDNQVSVKLGYRYIGFINDDDYELVSWSVGFGHVAELGATYKALGVSLGYRYFNKFFAPYGEQLFSAVNIYNGKEFNDQRNMYTLDATYQLSQHQSFGLLFFAGLCFDPAFSSQAVDYNYGVMGRIRL